VTGKADEIDINRLRVGQPVLIGGDAFPGGVSRESRPYLEGWRAAGTLAYVGFSADGDDLPGNREQPEGDRRADRRGS
jgi:hypothetical protein